MLAHDFSQFKSSKMHKRVRDPAARTMVHACAGALACPELVHPFVCLCAGLSRPTTPARLTHLTCARPVGRAADGRRGMAARIASPSIEIAGGDIDFTYYVEDNR